ncbi:hypothetical protein MRX96_024884 [Rhipicephalus microplus]
MKTVEAFCACPRTRSTCACWGAAAGGMTLGWHIRNHGVSARLLQLMDFPGELYMRMLECLVMPVVASSIVAGLGSVDIMLAGQIGLLAMVYFVLATGLASAIGIGVALVLGPQNEPCWQRQYIQVDGFLDLLRNLFPDNYIEACIRYTYTKMPPQNETGMVDDEVIHVVMDSRANILGLLSMSVMLGAVLSVTASESDSLLNLFVGLSNATVTVSQLTAWVSPVGVFFLVATRLSQTSELDHSFGAMGTLLLVSVAALAAYGLGLLPALYVLVTRKDARRFLRITCAPAMKAFPLGVAHRERAGHHRGPGGPGGTRSSRRALRRSGGRQREHVRHGRGRRRHGGRHRPPRRRAAGSRRSLYYRVPPLNA